MRTLSTSIEVFYIYISDGVYFMCCLLCLLQITKQLLNSRRIHCCAESPLYSLDILIFANLLTIWWLVAILCKVPLRSFSAICQFLFLLEKLSPLTCIDYHILTTQIV